MIKKKLSSNNPISCALKIVINFLTDYLKAQHTITQQQKVSVISKNKNVALQLALKELITLYDYLVKCIKKEGENNDKTRRGNKK